MSYLETIAPDHDFTANNHVNWMLNIEIGQLIVREETGVLPTLYSLLEVDEKPLTPIEFYLFWTSLSPDEMQYYADAAFDSMP